jgi:putative spermidine/putrescine transport system ATP-binding protein
MYDVEIRGAAKQYGAVTVLNGINLQVNQGELLTLLGPSGCGKTTTLNMIAGFFDPDAGDVYIKGQRMNGVPAYKRDLGMVFQSYSLFPHMTVRENLEFGLKLRKIGKAEREQRIERAMTLVKMTGLEDRYPREMSGGQRQRVAIARALVVQPTLLLLDEPLSNLDAKLRHELRVEIKRLQKELGVTTIFVTHDQEEALSLSDRIVVMNQGSIEQIGTPTEIYQQPQSEFVFTFIGKSNKLPGRVESIADGVCQVRLDNGWLVPVRTDRKLGQDTPLPEGSAVKLYIRPENLHINEDSAYRGILAQANYMGSYWDMEVTAGKDILQLTSPTVQENWTPGREVGVRWQENDFRLAGA